MITMKDWKVYVPAKDRHIGHEKDNLFRKLEIQTDLPAGWAVTLDLKKGSGANCISLNYADGVLSVDLTEDMLADAGVYDAQLKGTCGEITAHSDHFLLEVGESINAFGEFPPLVPSAMEQMEAQLLAIKADTELAKAAAEASAAAAEECERSSQEAAERTEAARESIVLDEEKMAQVVSRVEESAGNAAASENNAKESKEAAAKAAALAQGYAEQASVPAVAGVYNVVLQDRETKDRYALIVESGKLKLLGVASTVEATSLTLIDPATGVTYEVAVDSGKLNLVEV